MERNSVLAPLPNKGIIGVLNATPDSCYDHGKYFPLESAIKRAQEIEAEGADILDIGGESSRPGASRVPLEEEERRVLPLIREIRTFSSLPISIDTTKPAVAKKALELGANLVNDIYGLEKEEMQQVVKEFDAPAIVMHMQNHPWNMQNDPFYKKGVVEETLEWFDKRLSLLTKAGIHKIFIDPGIGFGKTTADCLQLLQALGRFKEFGYPILIGASRKAFLREILQKPRDQLLPATLTIHTIAILSGADYIRVHDVKEHKDLVNLYRAFTSNLPSFTSSL